MIAEHFAIRYNYGAWTVVVKASVTPEAPGSVAVVSTHGSLQDALDQIVALTGHAVLLKVLHFPEVP